MSKKKASNLSSSIQSFIPFIPIAISIVTVTVLIGGSQIKCYLGIGENGCSTDNLPKIIIALIIFVALIAVSIYVLIIAIFKILGYFSKSEEENITDDDLGQLFPLGENPEPLRIFKYFQELIIANKSIIQNYEKHELYINQIVDDIKSGVLRIYFFGHQNAGKSSLINSLLEKKLLQNLFKK